MGTARLPGCCCLGAVEGQFLFRGLQVVDGVAAVPVFGERQAAASDCCCSPVPSLGSSHSLAAKDYYNSIHFSLSTRGPRSYFLETWEGKERLQLQRRVLQQKSNLMSQAVFLALFTHFLKYKTYSPGSECTRYAVCTAITCWLEKHWPTSFKFKVHKTKLPV